MKNKNVEKRVKAITKTLKEIRGDKKLYNDIKKISEARKGIEVKIKKRYVLRCEHNFVLARDMVITKGVISGNKIVTHPLRKDILYCSKCGETKEFKFKGDT